MKLISGLMALQLATAMTASAQTYNFTIGNAESAVRVADHLGGENIDLYSLGDQSTLESYNFQSGNSKLIGLIRFNGVNGTLAFATHYGLPNTTDYLRVLKGYQVDDKGPYIVAERVGENGIVKSAVLLQYDKENGKIISALELASLPPGYSFIRVFDIMENFGVPKPKRILCTLNKDGVPVIAELLYNSGQYIIHEYNVGRPPLAYKSVHYVRAYHYGGYGLGAPAFYGLADYGSNTTAFCYYEEPFNTTPVYERYSLTSAKGIRGISGVQINGSYGLSGSNFRIEMAFTDMDGGICIQQKDELVTTNWQRYYQFSNKEMFRLGWGRDGHGTKASPGNYEGLGYFLGALVLDKDPSKSKVTSLLFNGIDGSLIKPRVYDISGRGIFEDGSFPSTCYDEGSFYNGYLNNYTFIADRFEERNGFRFGTGNTLDNNAPNFFCADQHDISEVKGKRLAELKEEISLSKYGDFYANEIELEEHSVDVQVVMECPPEKGAGKQSSKGQLIQNNSELGMDAQHIRIAASSKAITSVRIFSIDGRTIADIKGVHASNYEHQFAKPLIPGIYVIHIAYDDHSKEVKKVSIR